MAVVPFTTVPEGAVPDDLAAGIAASVSPTDACGSEAGVESGSGSG
ncbi:hypothetical protein [uncultured Microbacterium sp.]|nr:hypothetical protein [uncultured Microbacterium sp.]